MIYLRSHQLVAIAFGVSCLAGCGVLFASREECAQTLQKAELAACYACIDEGGVYNKTVDECTLTEADRARDEAIQQQNYRRKQEAEQAARQADYERQLEAKRAYDARWSRKETSSSSRTRTTPQQPTNTQQPTNITITYTGEFVIRKLTDCDDAMSKYFSKSTETARKKARYECGACFNDSKGKDIWKIIMRNGVNDGYYCIDPELLKKQKYGF